MPRLGIGMRWWLASAFALIAALTALAVALIFSERSERAFRERSGEFAIGSTFVAAEGVRAAVEADELDRRLPEIAERRRLALFVFAANGTLISPERSRATLVSEVPKRDEALAAALEGERFAATLEDGSATVVALPIRSSLGAAVVVAYVPQPEFAASVGIWRHEIVVAALIALPVGALVGIIVALFIAARLRRIAAAAAAIERGIFTTPLRPRFRDELGALALTIDRMRVRLRDSFGQLESERDRLRRLLERLHEGVLTVNRDGEVEFVNAAGRRLLGAEQLSEGDPLPDPWPDLSLRRLAAGLFRPEAPVLQARVSPDEERTFAVVGVPSRREADSAMLVLTNISEQEQRERAEREFVANAAHELKTPLAVITGAVEVLQAGAKEIPAERDRFLGHIERESARLARLARAMLVLARTQTRQEAIRLAPVELRPLLEEVASALSPRDGVEVAILCPAGLSAYSERDLAEQVVANLAANAAKLTERGRIELAAQTLPDGTVAIEVRDTGPGIALREQERVFDRFYRGGTRDSEGFGLGLAIVRQATRALGGALTIESAPGTGTTMRVVLPGVDEADDLSASSAPGSREPV